MSGDAAAPSHPTRTPSAVEGSDTPHPEPVDGPQTPPTDAQLVDSHLDGDPSAFPELLRRHRDRLWSVSLRIMRNPHDAADALQDAYLAAYRRIGSFRGEAQVTTWLHRVVVNSCLDRLRRQQTRAREQPMPPDPDRAPLLADTAPDPLAAEELRVDVVTALGQLSADQRAALVLVDMEGYSVEEAATILGCAPGTVKSRCARGRVKLLPLLAHLADPEESGDER